MSSVSFARLSASAVDQLASSTSSVSNVASLLQSPSVAAFSLAAQQPAATSHQAGAAGTTSSSVATNGFSLQQPQPQPQPLAAAQDVYFKICLVGDSGSGKTSYRHCTTQILATRPEVTPSVASSHHQYFCKMKGGGKLHLEVVDFGPCGERDVFIVRRTIAPALFVVFVNLSVVKQKVDKGIFGGRTDTVILHNTVRDAITRWTKACYLMANGGACSIMMVGTHKDFLSVQDEPAMAALLQELRAVATQSIDAIVAAAAAAAAAASAPAQPPTLKNNKTQPPPQLSSSMVVAPKIFGTFAVSCVDHTCVSENREGPKTIKALWQFFCDLSPKLADRAPFFLAASSSSGGGVAAAAAAGAGGVLAGGAASSSSSSSSQRPATVLAELVLKASLNVLRHERGMRTVTLHDMFLFSLTQSISRRVMAAALRRRGSTGDISLTVVRRSQRRVSLAVIDLTNTSRLLAALDMLRRVVQRTLQESGGVGGGSANGGSPNSSAMAAAAKDGGGSDDKLVANVGDVAAQLPLAAQRDVARGVLPFETMPQLGALLGGVRCTATERASLLWQMTMCSGYFVPCASAGAAADCLLTGGGGGGVMPNVVGGSNKSAMARAAAVAAAAALSTQQKNAAHHPRSTADPYLVFTTGTRRRVPPEALEQLDSAASRFHTATRRIVFSADMAVLLGHSKAHVFSLFVGRLVNVANQSLLCPAHLFEHAAWLRDRSSAQCRLLVQVEAGSGGGGGGGGGAVSVSFRFVSSADTAVRAHAAFMVETLQAARTVFDDLALHRVAQWVAPEPGAPAFESPMDRHASGAEDVCRLDLAFGNDAN